MKLLWDISLQFDVYLELYISFQRANMIFNGLKLPSLLPVAPFTNMV